MKYIDTEKLIAEIERRIDSWSTREKHAPVGQGKDTCISRVTELSDLLSFVNSLQQDLPEVDLEKETEKYFNGWTETDEGIACHYQYVDLNTCHSIARHFYELGLKARKEGK